jgi:hypothetical protein
MSLAAILPEPFKTLGDRVSASAQIDPVNHDAPIFDAAYASNFRIERLLARSRRTFPYLNNSASKVASFEL